MKSFLEFRLDTTNRLLWKNGDRIPLAPKAFDVLAYLVMHAGQVVTQDEIFDALWQDSFVNPEVFRKYIREIRRALEDKVSDPEFIETLPKRGYRFIAPVTDYVEEKPLPPTLDEVSKGVEPASTDEAGLVTRPKRVVHVLMAIVGIVAITILLG